MFTTAAESTAQWAYNHQVRTGQVEPLDESFRCDQWS